MKNQIELITDSREIELLDSKRKIIIQELFTAQGMDALIEQIKQEVVDFKADVTTKEGRAAIKSMAAKVARCKSPIKELSMELKEDSRKFIDGVNLQYNRYEKEMDTLRDQIRKPVDEIEEREAALLAERKERIERIKNHGMLYNSTLQDISVTINNVKEILDFDNWGEFQFVAESAAKEVIEQLEALFKQKEEQIKKDAELEKLRKEAAERAQKDREEQIAREAAEKAKREAEEAAERERKAEENRRLQAEEEARRAEQAKIDAENRAKEAERLAAERAAQAELARIEAEKKAKEDAEKAAIAAVEAERKRVEEEEKKEREAAEKREANKKHRAKINNEALEAMAKIIHKEIYGETATSSDVSFDSAKKIIEAIAKGEVPHVSIKY